MKRISLSLVLFTAMSSKPTRKKAGSVYTVHKIALVQEYGIYTTISRSA